MGTLCTSPNYVMKKVWVITTAKSGTEQNLICQEILASFRVLGDPVKQMCFLISACQDFLRYGAETEL